MWDWLVYHFLTFHSIERLSSPLSCTPSHPHTHTHSLSVCAQCKIQWKRIYCYKKSLHKGASSTRRSRGKKAHFKRLSLSQTGTSTTTWVYLQHHKTSSLCGVTALCFCCCCCLLLRMDTWTVFMCWDISTANVPLSAVQSFPRIYCVCLSMGLLLFFVVEIKIHKSRSHNGMRLMHTQWTAPSPALLSSRLSLSLSSSLSTP